MIASLSNWINKISTGWIVISTLMIMVLFTALVLPNQARISIEETGSSVSPDTTLFYTPDEIYQIAESYGPNGRLAYLKARWTFDLIFPLVYVGFLTTGISWFYHRNPLQKESWRFVNLFPVFGGVFDYLENLATSLIMYIFPTRFPGAAFLSAVFSGIKWSLIVLSFLVYLYLLVIFFIQWITKTRSGKTT
jgi:hypothetical protein